MLGQSSGLKYEKIEDFKSAADYIQYLFAGIRGWICKGQITGKYNQQMYRYNGLMKCDHEGNNIYISMNTFYKPRRTIENLKRLNALYVDIDCYKLGLSKQSVLYFLEQDYFETQIPVPTFVIDSGRGLYLIWKLRDEDRNALPRWIKVQKYLTDKLKDFGADAACKDGARILRLPFSVNQKSGTQVKILRFSDLTYTISEIQNEYDIVQGYKRREKIYPYNTATESMRRYATLIANKMGVELPNFDNFAITQKWIAEMRVKMQSRFHSVDVDKPMDVSKSAKNHYQHILKGYCIDLETLFKIRKGVDCKRELALFLYRLFTYDMTGDKELALKKTLSFNASLSCPFPDEYVVRTTKSAETKIDGGDTYHYRIETIIDMLEITDEEMIHLAYLINKAHKKERKKKKNRKQYLERLASEGKETKAETQKKRRAAIVAMQKKGKSKKEIMEALSISKATYYRDLMAISTIEIEENDKEDVSEIVKNTTRKRIKMIAKTITDILISYKNDGVSKIKSTYYKSKALLCRTDSGFYFNSS